MRSTLIILSLLFSLSAPLPAQSEDDLAPVEEVKEPLRPSFEYGAEGFIDASGNRAVPPGYDFIFPKKWATFMLVGKNGKFGAIDARNNTIIPLEYDTLQMVQTWTIGKRSTPGEVDTTGLRLIAKRNGVFGLLDASGKTILPFVYSAISGENAMLLDLCRDGKWGLAYKRGTILADCRYDARLKPDIDSRTAIAAQNGLYGIIDFTDNRLAPFKYEQIRTDGSSYYQITRNGKVGLLDKKTMKVTFQAEYDSLKKLDNKSVYWAAEKNGRFGLLRQDGAVLLPFEFDAVTMPFYGFPDCALVKTGADAYTVYNVAGERILPGAYAEIRSYLRSAFIVKNSAGRYGMLRPGGAEILPLVYDDIQNKMSRSLFVRKGDRYAAFDTTGKRVTPFQIEGFGQGNPYAANLADGKMLLVGLNKDGLPDYTVFDEAEAFDPGFTNFIVAQTQKGAKRYGFVFEFKLVAPVVYEKIGHIPNKIKQQLETSDSDAYRYVALGTLPGGKQQLIGRDGSVKDLP